MEQRMLRPAAPSTSCACPLAGRPHPAEPGRGAVAAAGPTLRPARSVAEAARPLRPASSVAEEARRRLPAHRPQGSCGGMFLDPESTAIPLRLLSPSTHPRSPRRLHRRPISWNASDAMLLSSDGGFSLPYRSGLWGWVCRSSPTEKDNCVLRCLSLECYDLIYGGDPLEEGELDYVRGQEYKYCMHK
ncbi:unnamed protein product [Miscanthus lutarioriparius]|uniref:Uncharacterized protein n=1 Tax=Miscanthus lutarioriparius TaxID=422564 RepID=A0A811RR44_9POAL|nr:unnamed protein product [Miscanthus lutarioriparius]